jgi:hypothetical protein
MKDLNYILDNFPIDKFINIDDDIIVNKNKKNKTKIINTPLRYNSQKNNKIYKLTLDKQEDIIKICKILHSIDFYRLVCLTLNLVYWIVFGNQNNVQIDQNTKEYLYLKILNQIEIINSKIPDIKLLSKVFIPLEIILIRIEMDNYLNKKFILLFDEEKSPHNKEKVMAKVNNIITEIFDKHGYMNSFETIFGSRDDLNKKISNNYLSRKFIHLFDDDNKENKENIMIKVNNLITEIFDKHGYMNSFETICGTRKEFNVKFIKNLLPRLKRNIFETSNMLEQLFNNDRLNTSKTNLESIKQRQDFILGPKADFFNSYLTKINNKLKKRNLAPIFTVSNNSQTKIIQNKTEEIFDKKTKNEFNIITENSNTKDNERYNRFESLENYMDKSINKFDKAFRTPKLKNLVI